MLQQGLVVLGHRQHLLQLQAMTKHRNFAVEIAKEGVNLDFAVFDAKKRVSGVYVHLTEKCERVFKDYVDETPNLQVTPQQLQEEAFKRASILNVCSGTMFEETALKTTRAAVDMAKDKGAIIAIDANIRPLRWESEEVCRETITSFFEDADILKLTDEELYFLTETTTIEEGLQKLDELLVPIVLVTVGADGAYAVLNGEVTHVPVERVVPVDTTGAKVMRLWLVYSAMFISMVYLQ